MIENKIYKQNDCISTKNKINRNISPRNTGHFITNISSPLVLYSIFSILNNKKTI